jgi:translation initiation factor IF-2
VRLIRSAGIITESDINLASASQAIIIAFHIKIDNRTRELASKHKVTIEEGSIIYNVIESVKRIASGLLAPTITEKYLGTAQVREMFNLTNVGLVAGCMVSDGVIERSASVRVMRNGFKIYEGKIKTLRRFKDDVKEVTKGSECGISIDRYDNLQAGDVLEVFNLIEQARTLD